MHLWILALLAVFVMVAFVLLGMALSLYQDEWWGILCFFIGLFLVALLALSPVWSPSGLPLHNIDSGTYKVAFVYVAGENVNVAVEWKTDAKVVSEGIYYYQFKKDAFEGNLNLNAKKLVVVQSGSFKKLRLE